MGKRKEMDTRNSLRVVTSNEFIILEGLERLSLKARKLLYLTASQCTINDDEFYEYKISVIAFAAMMEIEPSNVYQEADKIAGELAAFALPFKNVGAERFKYIPVTSLSEYEDGYLKIELNKRMTDYLLHLASNFSQPLLYDFMKMKSTQSMAIWHLMQREMQSKKPGTRRIEFYLDLDEMRRVSGTVDIYKKIGMWIVRVLDKAIREISDCCSTQITYTYVKKGREVVGFDFVATNEHGIDITDYTPSQDVVNKCRLFELKQLQSERNLTEEEASEYENLLLVLK